MKTKRYYRQLATAHRDAWYSMYRNYKNTVDRLESLVPFVGHKTNCAQLSGECTCGLQEVLDAS